MAANMCDRLLYLRPCRLLLHLFLCLKSTMHGLVRPIYCPRLVCYEIQIAVAATDHILAGTPPWGKMSDIFGRKPILMCTIFIFFIGSLIGALSINIQMLLAGRVIQGIGAGAILGLPATIIGDVFSPR